MYVAWLTPHLMDPRGSEGDQEYIFFTFDTFLATFIVNILQYNSRYWKCDRIDRTNGVGPKEVIRTDYVYVGIVM